MKLKDDVDLNQLACTIDNEGFWYALTGGGYIDPSKLLDNPMDVMRVMAAVNVILEFENLMPEL